MWVANLEIEDARGNVASGGRRLDWRVLYSAEPAGTLSLLLTRFCSGSNKYHIPIHEPSGAEWKDWRSF